MHAAVRITSSKSSFWSTWRRCLIKCVEPPCIGIVERNQKTSLAGLIENYDRALTSSSSGTHRQDRRIRLVQPLDAAAAGNPEFASQSSDNTHPCGQCDSSGTQTSS